MLKDQKGQYTDAMIKQSANLVGGIWRAINSAFAEAKDAQFRSKTPKYREDVSKFVSFYENDGLLDPEKSGHFARFQGYKLKK